MARSMLFSLRAGALALLGASLGVFFACKDRGGAASGVLDSAAAPGAGADAAANPAFPATLSPDLTAAGVWAKVISDPYPMPLPHNDVGLWKFASSSVNPSPDRLAARAATTVADTDNISARFEKLVHANGVCARGHWIIDQDSPFTGHFAKGTNAPFIGRLSVAFNDLNRGDYRAFGVAGKIFFAGPDKSGQTAYKTANFFTIDDLAGTTAPNITDVTFSNEPPLTKANLVTQGPTVVAIGAATAIAFALGDSNPGMRQLYEISELGLADPRSAITPKWMHLKATTPLKNGHPDFRQDLRADNFAGPLTFDISVSHSSQTFMRTIGHIVLDEMVASDTCDHRLHFHHPKFRTDLNFGL